MPALQMLRGIVVWQAHGRSKNPIVFYTFYSTAPYGVSAASKVSGTIFPYTMAAMPLLTNKKIMLPLLAHHLVC